MITTGSVPFGSPELLRPVKHQADTTGVVYIAHDRVYRDISPLAWQETLKILDSPLWRELTERRLVPATIVAERSAKRLILAHERADFILYGSEWTFSMLKRAVLMMLAIMELCREHNYRLQDGHLWNVVFFGSEPRLVDFGSLKGGQAQPDASCFREVIMHAFLPLLLWSQGDFYLAQRLLSDPMPKRLQPFPSYLDSPLHIQRLKAFRKKRDVPYLLGLICNLAMLPFPRLNKYHFKIGRRPALRYPSLEEIRSETVKLTAPEVPLVWYSHRERSCDGRELSPRLQKIISLLSKVKWSTAVDLDSGGGFFALQLLKHFPDAKVLCLDSDARISERAYMRSLKSATPSKNLTCGLVNFCYPVEGFMPLAKRIIADMVLVMSATDNLFLRQGIDSKVVFRFLHEASKRYLAIEFMPPDINHVSGDEPAPSWYTETWFCKELEFCFTVLRREQFEDGRVFFLCERRKIVKTGMHGCE